MNTRLAYVVFAFAFVVVIYVGLIRNGKDDVESKSIPLKAFEFQPERRNPAREGAPTALPKPSPSPSESKTSRGLTPGEFSRKYGADLSLEGSPRVSSIRGSGSGGANPPSGFSTRQEPAAIRRAAEILADARDLLGIRDEMPLISPRVSATDHHAQVTFQQSFGGVPLVPSGTVTVLLNRQGALKALHSDYHTDARISNSPRIPTPSGARSVLWVRASLPVAELKHAIERREDGFQILIDAETGETLLRRNRQIR